nr:MAG TPA: hypothetical protein [Caudoviricetes sp.]
MRRRTFLSVQGREGCLIHQTVECSHSTASRSGDIRDPFDLSHSGARIWFVFGAIFAVGGVCTYPERPAFSLEGGFGPALCALAFSVRQCVDADGCFGFAAFFVACDVQVVDVGDDARCHRRASSPSLAAAWSAYSARLFSNSAFMTSSGWLATMRPAITRARMHRGMSAQARRWRKPCQPWWPVRSWSISSLYFAGINISVVTSPPPDRG